MTEVHMINTDQMPTVLCGASAKKSYNELTKSFVMNCVGLSLSLSLSLYT